jgi:hypothetical protein
MLPASAASLWRYVKSTQPRRAAKRKVANPERRGAHTGANM